MIWTCLSSLPFCEPPCHTAPILFCLIFVCLLHDRPAISSLFFICYSLYHFLTHLDTFVYILCGCFFSIHLDILWFILSFCHFDHGTAIIPLQEWRTFRILIPAITAVDHAVAAFAELAGVSSANTIWTSAAAASASMLTLSASRSTDNMCLPHSYE